MKKLTFKETLFVASTLFGMFFGAGNLIFPASMGQLAGKHIWQAAAGFLITGVGLPLLGVAALVGLAVGLILHGLKKRDGVPLEGSAVPGLMISGNPCAGAFAAHNLVEGFRPPSVGDDGIYPLGGGQSRRPQFCFHAAGSAPGARAPRQRKNRFIEELNPAD